MKHLPMSLCLLLLLATGLRAEPPVKPAGLKPGDTIMFIAPAGPAKHDALKLARERLEAKGFRVKVPENIFRKRGYLAGTDEQRAAELMAAFTDPEVDAVFPATGGYGTTRILDMLDYEQIAAHPKVFIGFSDITGLHLALAKKCNWVTYHSPNMQFGLGKEEGLPEFHSKYFWNSILANPDPMPGGIVYEAPTPELPITSITPGVAQGRLAGGNLSLIAALMGTPYEVETAGRILFLEDIREAPYRVDRMLSQLRLAGKLDNVAAVVLGSYYKCEDDDEDYDGLTLDEVFDDYFKDAPYPVIKGLPAGHGPWNATVPMGIRAEVNGDTATVRLLEEPVRRGE